MGCFQVGSNLIFGTLNLVSWIGNLCRVYSGRSPWEQWEQQMVKMGQHPKKCQPLAFGKKIENSSRDQRGLIYFSLESK
jgi:hypothetical protein